MKSLQKRRVRQAIMAGLVIVGVLAGVANASALLSGTGHPETAMREEAKVVSRVVSGRIISIDANKSLVTIFDTKKRLLEIQSQTVILREGSLAGFGDVVPGLTARAEFDGTEPSKLMRLKIDS